MRLLKSILKYTISLLLLGLLGGWIFTYWQSPKYDGEISLKVEDEVSVYFDAYGVPHIYAQTEEDAYTTLGYVHAQDRLWQMELIRRIGPGRLSEIFGKDLIETDVLFKTLGIEENTEQVLETIHKESKFYKLAEAYLKGINQFIEVGKTPIEYTLVGVAKEKYTIKDILNVYGYMAFSFANAHKTDPLLTEIKEKLGIKYLLELNIPIYEDTSLLETEKGEIIEGSMTVAINQIINHLPISPFIGSNSWVVSGSKTKSGKVLFANDPHIGFSQPSVWYQAHIKTPDYEMYGYNLALTPFPLLGHNRDYAYGLTMFENDDVEFYYEEQHPNRDQYKTEKGYVDYKKVQKTLKIKDKRDSVFQVKVTRHGPIINSALKSKSEKPISISWLYTKKENKLLEMSYQLAHSKSLKEFRQGTRLLHAPGLNIMYGDAKNNIAWFAAGSLYNYRDSLNTKLFLNGSSGKDEVVSFVNFNDNPQSINPLKGYVYSANNKPDSVNGKFYPGYYLPEDRGKRIENLLDKGFNLTIDDFKNMILDVTSPVAPRIVSDLSSSLHNGVLNKRQQQALDTLKRWNGDFSKNKIAPTIYNRFIFEFLKNTFEDELGEENFETFIDTHLMKKMIAVQAAKDTSIWWDNLTTRGVEDKKDVVTKSFKNTIKFLSNQLGDDILSWRYSRVLSLEHPHPLGKIEFLRSTFNVGPYKTDGGNEVVNNQLFKLNSKGYYKITAGPSTRRVIDFSDIENSYTILPTGQSGNVFSSHYNDQAKMYVEGEFVKMLLNGEEIKKSKNVLIVKPQ